MLGTLATQEAELGGPRVACLPGQQSESKAGLSHCKVGGF